eukprot:gene4099-14560_t
MIDHTGGNIDEKHRVLVLSTEAPKTHKNNIIAMWICLNETGLQVEDCLRNLIETYNSVFPDKTFPMNPPEDFHFKADQAGALKNGIKAVFENAVVGDDFRHL